jgi:K+-transporting ATPase KdpF subunit
MRVVRGIGHSAGRKKVERVMPDPSVRAAVRGHPPARIFTRLRLCATVRRVQHSTSRIRAQEHRHGLVDLASIAGPQHRDLRPVLPGRQTEACAMTTVELVGLVVVIALGVYLFVALLSPEKF